MIDSIWTNAEKKIARRVFDAAAERELSLLISEFKSKAASATDTETLWNIRDWLNKRQSEIDSEFDYRYSRLIFVFANLIRARKININDLAGISEQKLAEILSLTEQ